MSAKPILVAVRDLEADATALVSKAGQLAEALGAPVELFCPFGPLLHGALAVYAELVPEHCAVGTHTERQLEELARPLRGRGLSVATHVELDLGVTVPEAVARRADEIQARLVIAAGEALGGRTHWLRLSDWELVRLCPAPLLLLKDARAYNAPPVLAAVDPLHAHAKPGSLDRAILAQARLLAERLGGQLHVVHVIAPPPVTALPPNYASAEAVDILRTSAEQRAREAVTALLAEDPLPAQVHFRTDAPHRAIPLAAEAAATQIVVMGAVSRSRLKRWLIGDTARRTLDDLDCDVLIVKPPRRDA